MKKSGANCFFGIFFFSVAVKLILDIRDLIDGETGRNLK